MFFFYNQTCLFCMITHQYAAGDMRQSHPWLDGRPRRWPVKFAALLQMNPTWDITLLRVSMFSSPAAFSLPLPLDKPHVVIYPLMTTVGSERTVVPLSTLLMSDTSKLALMLFRKDLALARGVNNRLTFVRRTKTQPSACASASVEHLRHLVEVRQPYSLYICLKCVVLFFYKLQKIQ